MNENEKKNDLSSVSEEVFARLGDPIKDVKEESADKWQGEVQRLGVQTKELAQNEPGSSEKSNENTAKSQKNSTPKVKKSAKERLASFLSVMGRFFSGRLGEGRRFEISRVKAVVFFSVLSVVALIFCTALSYSYSGNSIRLQSQLILSERSKIDGYSIVYSENDLFGSSAATALRELFLTKTGASLKVVSDKESVSRHEIRVGYTSRMTDDYLTSISALGTDGYAIMFTAGSHVNIVAFSEKGAEAAIKYFVENYVGSYIGEKLTFSNNMNLSVVSRSGEEPQSELRESVLPLNFTKSGKFKMLVLSDADINPYTVEAIEKICERETPQLVVFAGDISSGMTTKAELEEYAASLVSPLETAGIPWAVIFGEQDSDGGLSAQVQMEVYSTFKYCVSAQHMITNDSISYLLPVFEFGEGGDDGSAPIFGVWAMGQTGDADNGHISSEHVSWFIESSKIMSREGDGSFPSVVITHTPTYEFSILAENSDKYKLSGVIGEDVSYAAVNSGIFAACSELGSVFGIYAGHDHLNSFAGDYLGIELGNVASVGYDGYGFGGTFEMNNQLRGGRLIELEIRDGRLLHTSKMVLGADYGISVD